MFFCYPGRRIIHQLNSHGRLVAQILCLSPRQALDHTIIVVVVVGKVMVIVTLTLLHLVITPSPLIVTVTLTAEIDTDQSHCKFRVCIITESLVSLFLSTAGLSLLARDPVSSYFSSIVNVCDIVCY